MVVPAASNSDVVSVPIVPGAAYLVHGRDGPRVLLVATCCYCGRGQLHQHVGQAGTVKRAPCGGGRYVVSVNAVYDGRT